MKQWVRCLWPVGLMLAAATAGCSGSDQSRDVSSPNPSAASVDAATAGNLSGRVVFDGPPPASPPISMASDPNCRPATPLTGDTVVVGTGGGLENVFVYIKTGLEGRSFPVPTAPAVLDQSGCRYTPRVIGVQVGQRLDVLNSDPTFHNVHATGAVNREINLAQPTRGMRMTHTFTAAEVMVPFRCDVHPWMHAWVGVVEHPYFAVTGTDGSFELKDLPAGTYTVEAWHEQLGTQTQTITVGARATATTSFTFKS
jgi:plastocyanin